MKHTTKEHSRTEASARGLAMVVLRGLLLAVLILPGWFVLLAMMGPACSRDRELGPRPTTCMANLKSISSAIETYKADNRSRTPRLHKYGDPVRPLSYDTHANELWVTQGDEDRPTPALGTAAMQNVWLLIAKDLIPQDAFTCPRDANFEERRETTRYGWTSRRQFSYGMHYPYDGPDENTKNPAAWTDHINGSVAILADQNPASLTNERRGKGVRSTPPAVAPSNHPKDGQAYLLANGSASFYKELDPLNDNRPKDSRCGKDGDDIYTAQNGRGAIPGRTADEKGNTIRGELDTYIVPTTDR